MDVQFPSRSARVIPPTRLVSLFVLLSVLVSIALSACDPADGGKPTAGGNSNSVSIALSACDPADPTAD